MRIYEEVRVALDEREQMGSHCKYKQIYGFSNLLLEPSTPQGTILQAAVARSHHTLAPIPFYSCNKHWGGWAVASQKICISELCKTLAKRLRVSDRLEGPSPLWQLRHFHTEMEW